MSVDDKLNEAVRKAYSDFRDQQEARGRPVCDVFEPCKAAQSEPHPWSTAPEFTPCGRCGWSRRTHNSGAITIKAEAGTVHIDRAHTATLPTGEHVELPAGTVLREGTLPPEAEDDRPTLGEQIHDEHDRALRDLTERVGLPREMAPSVERDPNDSSWAARYTEAMRVNAIQRAEIERLHKALETSATPADRAVGAAMLGSLR